MSKKVILTIVTLVLVVALSGISVSCGPSEPTQFVTYTDEANGFSIDYPEGWDIKYHAEHPREKVCIYTETWDLKAVTIIVHKVGSQGLSLETCSELLIKAAPDNFEDYTPISTVELTVNGMPAVKHTYTHTLKATTFTAMMVCLVEGGTVWILFFESPQKSFDSYESTFDTALNSFCLL